MLQFIGNTNFVRNWVSIDFQTKCQLCLGTVQLHYILLLVNTDLLDLCLPNIKRFCKHFLFKISMQYLSLKLFRTPLIQWIGVCPLSPYLFL